MMDCARKTVQKEGLGGLYKGVASPLAGQALFNAVQFFAYGQAQRLMLGADAPKGKRLSVQQSFVAGAITGMFVALVECPQDLFKSQIQVQVFKEKPQFTGVAGAVKEIWRTGGVRSVYQGFGPTLTRNVFSVSMYFGWYEWTRDQIAASRGCQVSDLDGFDVFAAGGLGGIMYWGINFPMDVIKSSMQSDSIVRSERRFSGILDCARKLYKEGGIKRFYSGYAPCMARSIPANAACFVAYEKTKQLLE
eukprot:TRINITY_DN65758_c5_g1_i2.p2 TRINITY_DN65758_c5_g1~~TRINITY_DN65758_c5_g1_i2.p2  ORF type:complete len:249 (-),score=120.18 TRINITY_DN65758_c5_g1_i2:163-909(-)